MVGLVWLMLRGVQLAVQQQHVVEPRAAGRGHKACVTHQPGIFLQQVVPVLVFIPLAMLGDNPLA